MPFKNTLVYAPWLTGSLLFSTLLFGYFTLVNEGQIWFEFFEEGKSFSHIKNLP
jgi:hypothetical protein